MNHPLGFRKRTLLNLFGYRIRLHIWNGEINKKAHNHPYRFLGLPLKGKFREYRWLTGPGDSHIRYEVPEPSGLDRNLYNPQPCGLYHLATHVRRPLRPYRCSPTAIHSFERIGEGPHLSVVFIGRLKSNISHVYEEAGNDS